MDVYMRRFTGICIPFSTARGSEVNLHALAALPGVASAALGICFYRGLAQLVARRWGEMSQWLITREETLENLFSKMFFRGRRR